MSTSKPMTEWAMRNLERACGNEEVAEVRRLLDKAKRDMDQLCLLNPKCDAKYRAAFVDACRRITDEARKTVGTHAVAAAFRNEDD